MTTQSQIGTEPDATDPAVVVDLESGRRRVRPGAWRRLVAEARSRPFGYAVLAAFLVAGPFVAAYLFPEAPRPVAVIGGLIFGGYAALCAVPQKFL